MIKLPFGRGSGTLHIAPLRLRLDQVGAGFYHARNSGYRQSTSYTVGDGGWRYNLVYTAPRDLLDTDGNGGGLYPHYAIIGGSFDSTAER